MKQLKFNLKFLIIALMMVFLCACGLDLVATQGTAAKQKQEEKRIAEEQAQHYKEKLEKAEKERQEKLKEYE